MPFWYHVPIPTLPEPDPRLVRLVKWLVEDGAEVHPGTRLAIIEASTGSFVVLTNGAGFLREKLLPTGAELPPGTPIATINTDGEKIPYGRPYSIAERLDAPGESGI
jgi:pyruvate/2-oxoglutarate dehydrogenase complex dihydrolipoamide acyltransferase (E2) component